MTSDIEPNCTHLRVERRTKYDHDRATDHWHCTDCQVEFLPKPEVATTEHLLEALRGEG